MHYYKAKASSSTTKQPEKKRMASAAPIAIGTRGTVGALVRKEIEYFAKLELDRPRKPRSGGSHSQQHVHHQANWPSFRFLVATWKRKKHRGSRSFLPSLCSAAEVAEMNRLNGIPGFGYRPLRDDMSYSLEL